MYVDDKGLIVQKDGDGGDSAQRTGFYYTARFIVGPLPGYKEISMGLVIEDFIRATTLLITPAGLIRNPVKWNDPKDTSRDQTTPMIIACGCLRLLEMVDKLRPKYLRYQNGDFASPQNLNEVRRALGKTPLLLGDLWAIGASYVRCRQAAKDMDDVGDDLNLLISLVFFNRYQSNAVTRFALKYYLKNRPTNFGCTKMGETDPVIGALVWYFREESGGNPEIAQAWRPIITKYREDLGC